MKLPWYLIPILAALVIGLAAFLVLGPSSAPPPAPANLAQSKPSAAGFYEIAIAPDKEPVARGELHSWTLELKDKAGAPVDGATIAVGGGMPEHNHGLPTAPQATGLGNGKYRIDGVKFSMGGRWELTFDIDAPPGKDTVLFEIMM